MPEKRTAQKRIRKEKLPEVESFQKSISSKPKESVADDLEWETREFVKTDFKIPKGETLAITLFNKKRMPVYAITYKTYMRDVYYLYEVKSNTLTKIDKGNNPKELEKKIKKK